MKIAMRIELVWSWAKNLFLSKWFSVKAKLGAKYFVDGLHETIFDAPDVPTLDSRYSLT